MKELFSFLRNGKNFSNILLTGILVASIPLTIGLVQTTQVLKTRALGNDEIIQFVGANVKDVDGKEVAIKPQVALQLASPFGPPPGAGSAVSSQGFLQEFTLMSRVYAQEDGDDYAYQDQYGYQNEYSGQYSDEYDYQYQDEYSSQDTETEDESQSQGYDYQSQDTEGQGGNEVEYTPVGIADDVFETCIDDCDDIVEVAGVSVESGLSQIPNKVPLYKEVTDINGNVSYALIPPGNQYGEWDLKRATQRPYFFLSLDDLDELQKAVVAKWEKSPYNTVWRYYGDPGAHDNWAGWGPPPPGWTTRSEIPRTAEGAFLGDKLPWPPAGSPDDIGVHNDPLYLSSLTPEEFAAYEREELNEDQVRQINQQRFDESMPDNIRYSKEVKQMFGGVPPQNYCQEFVDDPACKATVKTTVSQLKSGTKSNNIGQSKTAGGSKQNRQSSQGASNVPPIVAPVAGMNPNFCTTHPNDPICPGGGVSCSFQRACQDQNGRGGVQSCASRKGPSGQCTQDPTLIQSCGVCVVSDLNIVTRPTSPIGSNVGIGVSVRSSSSSTNHGTTIGYRIAEDLALLTQDDSKLPWIAYAQSEEASLFPYKEPLVINYTFKDTTPGKKFIFVQFLDSTGKKGGCGDNKNQVCIATIELVANTSGKSAGCTIETKSLADHNKDKVVNSLDASEQKKLLEAASKDLKNVKGDLNKDGITNVCDYSLILTSFGAIK